LASITADSGRLPDKLVLLCAEFLLLEDAANSEQPESFELMDELGLDLPDFSVTTDEQVEFAPLCITLSLPSALELLSFFLSGLCGLWSREESL
jgi:hypothetical protein